MVETYITAVLLIAPGFVAKQTAKWLGDYTPKTNSPLDFIMSYFVYSLFSYCLIIALMFLFGMANMHKTNMHDTLLNEGLLDGKLHLIRIIKDGRELAVGKFCGASLCGDDITNNLIECFNKQFKAWYKTKQGFFSFSCANNPISMLVFFYNFVRPHSALNYLTPAQCAGLKLSKKRKRELLLVA